MKTYRVEVIKEGPEPDIEEHVSKNELVSTIVNALSNRYVSHVSVYEEEVVGRSVTEELLGR